MNSPVDGGVPSVVDDEVPNGNSISEVHVESEATDNAIETSLQPMEDNEYSNEYMVLDYDTLTNFQADFNPDLTLEIPLNSPDINIELSSNIDNSYNTSHIQTQRILL